MRLILKVCSLVLILSSCAAPVKPPAALEVVPSPAQLRWHRMEMNAFVHFSINTFTDKEWGYGDESPLLFNPDSLNTDQWTRIFKETGFKSVILTSKHHDGFCLWPSQYTVHSVARAGNKTDVVGSLARSAKNEGLNFGIYLSPWDRNHAEYGRPAYVEYYRNQLKELFGLYGPVFEMWFDGANGGDGFYGGARETRKINGSTYYDWPGTLELVRSMEPEIIFFSDAGPGVRWVGNERGIAGETNWNTITADTLFAGKAGIENLLQTGNPDGTKWIPAEVDVSIRPGWFYHASQDSLVKSPEKLFDIWLTSVGRGSTLLLNIPPDRHGRIHRRDEQALMGFRKILEKAFEKPLVAGGALEVSQDRGGSDQYGAGSLMDGDDQTYWATDDGVTSGTATVRWTSPKVMHYIMLQEPIALGQRVSSFVVEAEINGAWREVAQGTTIGYKRVLALDGIEASALRVSINQSKNCVALSTLEVY
ncbi:MAG: alpha-L-fucosidase [Bacteroidetes bacterium]|nr:alpha-L-fucosidase [Bacteroidota bacterium]